MKKKKDSPKFSKNKAKKIPNIKAENFIILRNLI